MPVTVTHSKTLVSPSTGAEDKVYGADYVAADSHTLSGLGTGVETALGIDVNTTGGVPTIGATLTSGRLAIVGTGGVLEDDAGLTYDKSTDALSVSGRIIGKVGTVSSTSYGFVGANAGNGIYARVLGVVTIAIGSTPELDIDNNTVAIGAPSSANCITLKRKAVASIADNTATAVFTVAIPNAPNTASIRVRLTGAMGAGGAIGARESTQDAEYMINVARTAGVNAVATIGAVVGQAAAAAVAGAGTVAVTGTLSAISGAVDATNTFTINVTIARSGGSSTNHTCNAFAEQVNAVANGITIA